MAAPISQLCSHRGLGLTGGLPARALSTHLYGSSSPCVCPQRRLLLASTHQIPCLDVPRCPAVTAKRDSSSFTPVTPPEAVPAARVPAPATKPMSMQAAVACSFPRSLQPAAACPALCLGFPTAPASLYSGSCGFCSHYWNSLESCYPPVSPGACGRGAVLVLSLSFLFYRPPPPG